MIRACVRCVARKGILGRSAPAVATRVSAWVGDALPIETLRVEVYLCSPCRSDATVENSQAMSRRTRKHWSIHL